MDHIARQVYANEVASTATEAVPRPTAHDEAAPGAPAAAVFDADSVASAETPGAPPGSTTHVEESAQIPPLYVLVEPISSPRQDDGAVAGGLGVPGTATPKSRHSSALPRLPHKHHREIKAQGNLVELDEQSLPITEENLLLRGCVVRNTKHVYGVAVYVGRSTKLFKNLKTKKIKRLSGLDRRINAMIFLVLFIQLVLTALFVLFASLFQNQVASVSYYMVQPGLTDFLFVLKSCITYFLVLSYFVPTSLFVSHEVVKVAQIGHMERDPKMRHNGMSMTARTSQLNQELSQIDVVISDKTGTLTENKMVFKKCWTLGYMHNEFEDEGGLGRFLRRDAQLLPSSAKHDLLRQQDSARHMLTCIALNHSVVPEPDPGSGQLLYHGQSSDEIALLIFAKQNGYGLVQRTNDGIELEIMGQRAYFEILETIPFSSDRKRMSVFVRGPEPDTVIMYSKGADAVMFQRSLNSAVIQETSRALNHFSIEGLRTLVFCYRVVRTQDFEAWQRRFQQACCSSKQREKKMNEVASEMEIEMQVSGCSGIEDKLQDGVPEAVEYLQRAGLQIWVLTGDKTQTAVNVAYSAKVLTKGVTREIKIRAKRRLDCKKKLIRALQYCHEHQGQAHQHPFAVIIDSKALKYALKRYRSRFVELVSQCQSCICCRVTPLQKAKVTALVNTQLKRKSLAIGDGANDVSMIQEAMIGVGIKGSEGSQASRAADYAIHRFKHIVRLMAVHGRWCYVGNSDFLHLSIWKNFIIGLIQLFYSIFSGYSGMIPMDNWVLQFYNSIFTSLPAGAAGGFERDLHEDIILRHPELYKEYKNDALFNIRTVIFWFGLSIYHACAIFFVYYGLQQTSDSGLIGFAGFSPTPGSGRMMQGDLWSDSYVFTTATFIVTIFKCALVTKYWSWFHHMSFWVSIVTYFGFSFGYALFPNFFDYSTYYMVPMAMATSPKAWLSLLLIVVVALLPDFALKVFKRNIWPAKWEKALIEDWHLRRHAGRLRRKGCDAAATGYDHGQSFNSGDATSVPTTVFAFHPTEGSDVTAPCAVAPSLPRHVHPLPEDAAATDAVCAAIDDDDDEEFDLEASGSAPQSPRMDRTAVMSDVHVLADLASETESLPPMVPLSAVSDLADGGLVDTETCTENAPDATDMTDITEAIT